MTEADPTDTTTPTPGEPMPDPADLTLDAPFAGEPMPHSDPINPITTAGDPMPDPTDALPDSFAQELMTDDDISTADTQRSMTRDDVARAILTGLACELGHDELRVLARIAERLKGGQTAYGTLTLATDTREFRSKEAREEIEDALVSLAYLACAWLKSETKEVN